jgi:hypothetical protein
MEKEQREMRQILGRIFLILIFTVNLYSKIDVSVSQPAIYRGDIVNFTISADGDTIEFPAVNEIAGYPIIGTSSSQSINIINEDVTKTISKTYSFKPQKSVTIPSFKVSVDGKSYDTEELKVEVLKPQISKNGDPFIFEIKLNKKEAFVGEPVELTLSFKRKLRARIDKLQLGEPKLDDFWVKKVNKVDQSSEGGYIVESKRYQLFPQKSGEFTIPSTEALIGVLSRRGMRGGLFDDPFFSAFTQDLNWQKIYSNEENLTVHPLPDGLELYGKYNISASVDKKEVRANKPVNLTIRVEGEGNIDDVKKFNLNIDSAIIYADEPKISSRLVAGVYGGLFRQKIAIIADSNFTIPPIELRYFDKETKEVKTVKTEPIDIIVTGGGEGVVKPSSVEVAPNSILQKPEVKTITKTEVIKEDSYLKYLFLAIGFIFGALTVLGFNRFKIKGSKKESDIVKSIRKAKNDRVLFDTLLPYSKKDEVILKALNRLEENIYRAGKNSIDREEIIEVFER